MRQNPVYKRETTVSSRSFRMILVILIFNGILAVVALLNMYSNLQRAKLTAEVQYSSFLNLFLFVAALEFIMVVFIMPALTSGSISGEYEKKTLDIMLTTKLTPGQIIGGKLMAALSTMGMLVVSSLPVLSLVFVYGGVSFTDVILFFISYMSAALLMGAIGICCSAYIKRTTMATITAYSVTGILILGTFAVNWIAVYISRITELAPGGSSLSLLLLFNPANTFIQILMRFSGTVPAGAGTLLPSVMGPVSLPPTVRIILGLAIQIIMAAVLVAASVHALRPGKGKTEKK